MTLKIFSNFCFLFQQMASLNIGRAGACVVVIKQPWLKSFHLDVFHLLKWLFLYHMTRKNFMRWRLFKSKDVCGFTYWYLERSKIKQNYRKEENIKLIEEQNSAMCQLKNGYWLFALYCSIQKLELPKAYFFFLSSSKEKPVFVTSVISCLQLIQLFCTLW